MNQIEKYPYFVYPAVMALKGCNDPARRAELKSFLAVNIGDSIALSALIGESETQSEELYSESRKPAKANGEDRIDKFIAKFGSATPLPPDSPLHPGNDFSAESPSSSEEDNPIKTQASQTNTERDSISMEEVKIHIKNGRYALALEIMETIYLNNPKKSVYFADQIRFIKKMMFNDSKKSNKQH